MDFDPDQCLATTKVIIKLTDMSRDSGLTNRPLHRRTRYETGAIIFYKENKHIYLEYHNSPLYVIASVHDVD